MKIAGSTFVITGGAQGLGKAMAKQLAASGAKLALVDVNQAVLDQAVSECSGQAKAYVANVTDEQQVDYLFSNIESDLGPIAGLVNNAGILRDGL